MTLIETITALFHEALETTDSELKCELTNESVLLNTGLDSLGFAILVARLEEELEYDPFAIMEEAIYPSTFGEFVNIYKKYQPAS